MIRIAHLNLNVGKQIHTIAVSVLYAYVVTSSGLAIAGEARVSTRTPVSELSWTEVSKGRSISPIYGDLKTGKHITFIRFAPGMKTEPHTHSNDYVGVLVKGTMRHYQPGLPKTETVLPAGSHWAIPGEVAHISECLPGSECVFAIYQEAPFDRKPVK
jgi:quercetin dioxygenase-like cupin family protein